MAFTFSLAAVLMLRRRREEAEERVLRQISSELESARETLHRIEAELRRLAAEHATEPPRRLQATDLHERYARRRLLNEGRAGVLSSIEILSGRQMAQQQAYLIARRDRELLERMEVEQRSVYLAGLARTETKRNDDAFLARFLRK